MNWTSDFDKHPRVGTPSLLFYKEQGAFDIVFSATDKVGPVEGALGKDADPALQAEVARKLHSLGLFKTAEAARDFLRIDAPSLDGLYQCDAVMDTLYREIAESDFMDDSVTSF